VALVDQQFVIITWGFITMLAAELVLSTGFLLITIILAARFGMPILKSSPLAPFLLVNTDVQAPLRSIRDIHAATREAGSLRVRF
jgi:hypothetical protein